MYSENQLAKIIADNVGKMTSLFDGALEYDEVNDVIIANSLLYAKYDIKVDNFTAIEDEDGNTLQGVLDGKSDKGFITLFNGEATPSSAADDVSLPNLALQEGTYYLLITDENELLIDFLPFLYVNGETANAYSPSDFNDYSTNFRLTLNNTPTGITITLPHELSVSSILNIKLAYKN